MQEVLALALQSMQHDMQRLDRIGVNLANALTPGYQREVVAARPLGLGNPAFGSLVGSPATPQATAADAPSRTLAPSLLIQTDLRPGSLKSTGQSLDVALAGPGFFEVVTPAGPAYTRQGNFRVDGQGRLVTAQGYPVMGRGGEIYLNDVQPHIDAMGNIYAADARQVAGGRTDAQPLAQLKVVQSDEPARLQHVGDGLMGGSGAFAMLPDTDIQIRQGFLENSNVSSMQEMVQLVQTMRHFESMQKVALGYDEMTGQAIRKLGELS
ncbi:flagellar hook-basal body protein [Paracidovorax anthurii]|uniref:Flagellar basal-body rod protein FlgG n=1 Tax=Paracidovorax anthurii TaxID=78229 RepID=A0A328YSZ2_9BURK|nr:flagellar hook-basal body protein [Paracidovorax anthurii]RAR75915.1 flagellar basal-body rod protein FlgG [Paracidovorax anthurii]